MTSVGVQILTNFNLQRTPRRCSDRSIFSVSCPVSWGPPLASSSYFLGEATWPARSPRDCTGSTFPHESSSYSVCGFPVPARVCTSLSCRLLHPGWCNWRTVKSTISGYRQLCVPRTKTVTIGPRAFAVSSRTAWDNLSVDLRDPNLSLSCFRKKLKTHLFEISSTVRGFLSSNCDCALLAAFETFLWKASDNINNNNN